MAQRNRRQAPPNRPARAHPWLIPLCALVAVATALGIWWWRRMPADPGLPASQAVVTPPGRVSDEGATFVGANTCAGCHPSQAERWRASMHARAMEAATPDAVEAPFAGERFALHGVTSSFSRTGTRFIVHTDGPDGTLQDFDVGYTFGVEPLQQYLLPLPGGRYQALSIA